MGDMKPCGRSKLSARAVYMNLKKILRPVWSAPNFLVYSGSTSTSTFDSSASELTLISR